MDLFWSNFTCVRIMKTNLKRIVLGNEYIGNYEGIAQNIYGFWRFVQEYFDNDEEIDQEDRCMDVLKI